MKSKMTALFATLMIALMIAGFAYAHWTETLIISGTVETGELDLALSFEAHDDADDAGKDVAEIDWTWVSEDELEITITNAYPCYTITGTFDIENEGTVPAVFDSYDIITLTINDYDPALLKWVGWPTVSVFYDANDDDVIDDCELWATVTLSFYGDPFGQIHPGETAYVDFELHFEQCLPESITITFKVKIVYVNWSP